MTKQPDLSPDCSACAALCCVGLAFDKGESFAIDKSAGVPCPNLSRHQCTIHDSLTQDGFTGCVRFDCQGAGQRTIALHGGHSWQDSRALLAPILETFRHLRRLHELIQLLETAEKLPLDPQEGHRCRDLLCALCPVEMTPDMAQTLATGPLPQETRDFLHSLSHHV